MLWRTARIHPRLTWLLFNLMKNPITNGPRDKLPKDAKQAMMAEADFEYIKRNPKAMAASMDGGAEALRQGGLGPAEAGSAVLETLGFRSGGYQDKGAYLARRGGRERPIRCARKSTGGETAERRGEVLPRRRTYLADP